MEVWLVTIRSSSVALHTRVSFRILVEGVKIGCNGILLGGKSYDAPGYFPIIMLLGVSYFYVITF